MKEEQKPNPYLGRVAISIRQPWAWLICHGFKDIENRHWRSNQRGLRLIHAAQMMSIVEYEGAKMMAHSINPAVNLPKYHALPRSGIVGEVEIVDCVMASDSPWFVGKFGYVLRNARPLPFVKCPGRLGFFKVQ